MIQDKKFIKKRFSFIVDTAAKTYTNKFELDKNIKLVIGLLMDSNKPSLIFYRGSQKIEVSGFEIFPEYWGSKLLMSGMNVSPNDKFADMGDGLLAGNGEVKVIFTDTPNTLAPFEAYEVSIYLICELA